MKPLYRVLMALLLVPFLLSGCVDDEGDDENDTTTDPDPNVGNNNTTNQTAEPTVVEVGLSGAYPATIAYDPASITVPANSTVTIRFTNNDQNPVASHDWVLEGYEDSASTEVIGNGETSEVTFEAPDPGTYTFYCSVPGHRDNGMEGTFTVE